MRAALLFVTLALVAVTLFVAVEAKDSSLTEKDFQGFFSAFVKKYNKKSVARMRQADIVCAIVPITSFVVTQPNCP
jgi:hypothetical protein